MAKTKQIGFHEAKPLAGALANFLQRLGDAEVVLDAAIRAEVEVRKLRGQAEDLRDEISDLQEQRDHVKQLFDSDRSHFSKLTDEVKAAAVKAEVTSSTVIEAAQKRSQNATVLYDERVEELRADIKVREHRAFTKIAEFRTTIGRWEQKLRDAKKAHADFLANLTGAKS